MIFVSKSYLAKDSTNHERISTLNRMLKTKEEYILPIKLDNIELPGLYDSVGYLGGNRITPREVCEIFLKKIGKRFVSNVDSVFVLYELRREKYSSIDQILKVNTLETRWSSKGSAIIHTTPAQALSVLERVAHWRFITPPSDLILVKYWVPSDISILSLHENDLPPEWDIFPYNPKTLEIGDKWFSENKTCILSVPSALLKGETNFLLNPLNEEFKKIHIEKEEFKFDKRLFNRNN